MKRLLALMLCLLLFCLLPCGWAGADDAFAFTGPMEVVNCSEWVSLRELPSTSSRRLVKVSLGAIVHNCQRFGDEWVYAEYDGHGGYILSRYLRPSENETTFSAMLVGGSGAAWYAAIDSESASGFLPAGSIVRSCSLKGGRVYAEFGGRCGFISQEHVQPYHSLAHIPPQMTLSIPLFGSDGTEAAPLLRAAWEEEVPSLRDPSGGYAEPGSDALPSGFLLFSDFTLRNVQLLSLDLQTMDSGSGEALFTAVLVHAESMVGPDQPLYVRADLGSALPSLAAGYLDPAGVYRFVLFGLSGEDGSVLLRAF